ncbi:rCG49446 [Rattus norvegicus]|uniref:RCG49446 n=1 Tax=Rattus norvegicus TaxID=10116 RepID=A6J3I7_RAT|nr:rCG49446 [Rattus norvegicus]
MEHLYLKHLWLGLGCPVSWNALCRTQWLKSTSRGLSGWILHSFSYLYGLLFLAAGLSPEFVAFGANSFNFIFLNLEFV